MGEIDLATRRALRWAERRTYRDVSPATGDARVSVVLPTLDEADTIGDICASIARELMPGLVDELIVLDGGSTDDTVEVARRTGATVVRKHDVLPNVAVADGKGEALWRSLAATTGDIVCWIDADIRNFTPDFVARLVAPLLDDDGIAFIKGFYRRPVEHDPDGGGRVTELLARPLLAMAFPELSGFIQPLAGEYAGRRSVLERVPFFTGYSVEVGLLIDLLDVVGLDAMAQVDLGERVHRNRPLAELAPMAHAIARTIVERAEQRGRLLTTLDDLGVPLLREGTALRATPISEIERPPIASLQPISALGG